MKGEHAVGAKIQWIEIAKPVICDIIYSMILLKCKLRLSMDKIWLKNVSENNNNKKSHTKSRYNGQ